MRLIFISGRTDKRNRVTLNLNLVLVALCLIILCAISVTLGHIFTKKYDVTPISNEQLAQALQEARSEVDAAKREAQTYLDTYSAYLAGIQARMVRLDAVGERLTNLAGISDEFDFSESVGLGGGDNEVDEDGQAFTPPTFMEALDKLSDRLATREKQLAVLENLVVKRSVRQENYISGYPVKNAYISSPYGGRVDPITGRTKGHKGIDFSAPRGTKIMSVAAGVVTFSGVRNGYGFVIEISHGDGYKTIYAHNDKNLVKVGDLVQTGQVIANVGTTGRTTGPHVHFEVTKNNQPVNPAQFIARSSKEPNLFMKMAKAE